MLRSFWLKVHEAPAVSGRWGVRRACGGPFECCEGFPFGFGSAVLVPPEAEVFPLPSLDLGSSSFDSAQVHWVSFALGVGTGLLLWPLLDLVFLIRLALLRGSRRIVRVPPTDLFRVLE